MDAPISQLTEQTTIHDSDLGVGVDTTDTSQATTGTTKKWKWSTIKSYLATYFSTLYASISTTINGHALSSNVVVSASDLTTGTLPHAQLPALFSGDIPNNAANTSGNATTATKLASAVYINGTAFDGSASIVNNLAEGQMINGKIVPTVTSNNITLTLVGNNGSALSATNIAYAMIGGTVRTINAPLSVTVNAGVNTFNSGSAELATKEIDYFVYLGYNATDGATLGFSRIPYGTCYGDFSATATNEKYCAISSIAHAASTDYYNVIGRFAATLGVSATYYWTVPAYTSINLIQRPIFETRWLTWTGTLVWTAGLAPASENANYKKSIYKIGNKICTIDILRLFTSAGTTVTQMTSSLPMTVDSLGLSSGNYAVMSSYLFNAAGETNSFHGQVDSSSNLLTITCASKTVSNISTQGFYEIA